MQLKSLLRASGAGLLLAAVAAFGALGCREDREVMMPVVGDTIFPFAVDAQFTAGIPAGSHVVNDYQVAGIDETVPDGFGRTQSFFVDSMSWVIGCVATGRCTGWEFPVRNASQDTRLPALQDDDATYLAGITPDSVFGVPWLLLVVNSGLDASTGYTVTLERSALTVNEGLDAVNVLFDNPDFRDFQRTPDAADALAPLGGTPGTTLGSNPYEIGTFTTDPTGATGLLIIPFTGTGNDDIIETNSLQGFNLPQYNYMVIYNTSTGDPVARAQVGVDLDATGDAVNNALAPYPDAAFTLAEALGQSGVAGKVSDLTFTFTGLAELSSTYQVWLYNEETEEFFSPTGTYTATDLDGETVATGTDVQTFDTQGDWTNTFQTTNPEIGDFTHVFLSIESAAATSPSAVQPLWSQYTDMVGAPTDPFQWSFTDAGSMSFGAFSAGDPAAYSVAGLGRGGFYGSEVRVNFVNLPLPPLGYYYEGWLVPATGSPVYLGALLGPYPQYDDLTDVGSDPTPPEFVVGNVILQSTNFALADDLGLIDTYGDPMWYDYSSYHLALSPLLRTTAMPPSTALGGAVPDLVKARRPPEP